MTRVAFSTPADPRPITVQLLDDAPGESWFGFSFGRQRGAKSVYRKDDLGQWLLDRPGMDPAPVSAASIVFSINRDHSLPFRWSLHHPGLIWVTCAGDGTHDWFCRVCEDTLCGFESEADAGADGRAHLDIHAGWWPRADTDHTWSGIGPCPVCARRAGHDECPPQLLPPDHPIRQEHARLTVALTLAEGRIATTLDHLDREAVTWPRSSAPGQLIEAVGCRLTGRNGSWKAGDR